MSDIKLQALDAEDLAIISAQCQDATVRVADVAYLLAERRFAMVCNRFDWLGAQTTAQSGITFTRRSAGLRFERVTRAQLTGFALAEPGRVLALLAIGFMPTVSPAGQITLLFAAGAAVRLDVEYIEVELKDLGHVWTTKYKPDHAMAEETANKPAPSSKVTK